MGQTPWLTTLQDDPDNVIYIGADLEALNPFEFQGLSWYVGNGTPGTTVVDRSPSGRESQYDVQQVLLGTPVTDDGGPACAWAHARNGDDDVQLWNSTTTDPDEHGSPVCRTILPGGDSDPDANPSSVRSALLHLGPGGDPIMRAQDRMMARGLWVRVAYDNLVAASPVNYKRGVLSLGLLDPIADGVPAEYAAEAEFEWHPDEDLELAGVSVTGDRSSRTTTLSTEAMFFLNDDILPSWTGGAWRDRWFKGAPGIDGETGKHLVFTYGNGDPVWYDLDYITDWGADYEAGEAPDARIGVAQANTPAVDETITNPSDIAVRLTLRSPRYRWVWDSETVVRQYPRDDFRGVSSAPRVWPPSKRNRIAGGYPGGSFA